MTSVEEMGNLMEPEDNAFHTCREKFGIFGYENEETAKACAQRYLNSNSTTPIIKEIYHANSVRECQINAGNIEGEVGQEWGHHRHGGKGKGVFEG